MTNQPATSAAPALDAVRDFGAALGGTQGFFQGDDFVALGDGAQADNEVIFRSGVTPDGVVSFLYEVVDGSPDDIVGDPTAVLVKDGLIIAAFALSDAIRHDDPDMVAVAVAMGDDDINPLLDPIPTPGADDWRVIRCDPAKRHTFKALADRVGVKVGGAVVAQSEGFGTLNDAKLLTAFDIDDPLYAQALTYSKGTLRPAKGKRGSDNATYRPVVTSIAGLVEELTDHTESRFKEGTAFVLGELVGTRRLKQAVTKCWGVGLDIDNGVSGAVVDAARVKFGHLSVRYTTHSAFKTTSYIKKETIQKHTDCTDVSIDGVIDYLRGGKKTGWDEAILETIEYVGDVQREAEGLAVELHHRPMEKHRVVFFFDKPFLPAGVAGKTHAQGMSMFADFCRALGQALGVKLDEACFDPSRLFFFPRHAPGASFETTIVGGPLLDWETLHVNAAVSAAEPGSFEAALEAEVARTTKKERKSKTQEGADLASHWGRNHADRFLAADFIKTYAEDRVRTEKGENQIEIECPFDEAHTVAGDADDVACSVWNAGSSDVPIFSISCRHDSCQGLTAFDHLGKMLKDDWFAASDLDDETFYFTTDDDAPTVVKGAAAGPPTADDVRAAIKALPPKKEGPDVKPILDMLARLDDKDDRETLIGLLRTHSGRAVGDLRKSVDERRKVKVKAKPGGAHDHIRTDAATGYRTFTFKSVPDDRKVRVFLIETMNHANKAAGLPLFSLNMGQPTALRRHEGVVSFETLDQKTFQADLFEFCSFAEHVEEGELTHKAPHADITGIVHAGLRPGELPNQPSIRRAPTIGKDGQVMDRDGWYGDVLVALGDLTPPVVPMNPTRSEVEAARDLLIDDLLGDFPFDDEDEDGARGRSKASLANAVAMMITQFCRDQFKGPSPLFSIVKPTAGVGGTLLAETTQRLFDGFPSTTTPNARSEDEMEKLMSSAAMGNESFMFFDNVRVFDSDTVKRTCTSERIGGRKLGSSQMVSRPNDICWQITGINPRLGSEMSRRSVFINLNSRLESNAKRNYRHEDFKGWLGENRSRVIGAILTLIRAWWVEGHEPSDDKLASFESWAGVLGGILKHAGIEGFLTNPREEAEDREGVEVKEFIAAWLTKFIARDTTEKEAFDFFDGDSAIISGFGDERRRGFGRTLDSLKGRAFEINGRLWMFTLGAVQGWRLVEIKAVDS